MAINRNDSSKINYKPDLDWYVERMYAIASGSDDLYKKYRPDEDKVDPKALLYRFRDLKKKAKKLDDAIDFLSAAEKIPVDVVKQPKVRIAVKSLDPDSGGEYISYQLYRDISLKAEMGARALSLKWGLENFTNDIYSNSDLIRQRYGSGAKFDPSYNSNKESGIGSTLASAGDEILDEINSWAMQEIDIALVLDFSNNFLASTRKSEYIPWNFKSDVRRKLIAYDDVDMFLSQYTDLVDDLSDSVQLIPNRPLELARDFYDAFVGKADTDNNFFNKINNIFGFNYTADLVCCFSGWASGLDLKTLEALRMVLSLVGNGMSFDYSKLLNSLIDIINNLFGGMISEALLGLVDKIFQMITNPIRNWLNTDDELWQKIFLCTPIDELVNTYLLGGIAYVEKKLIDKISEYLTILEINVHFEECKVALFGKTKELDIIINVIDMIIDMVGKLAYCGLESSPMSDRVSSLLQNVEIAPSWNYTYPKEENPNKYNSFTKNIITVEETTNPDTGSNEVVERTETVFVEGISTETISVSRERIDLCLKKIADEDVFSVQQWMEDLRSNSTEGMNV